MLNKQRGIFILALLVTGFSVFAACGGDFVVEEQRAAAAYLPPDKDPDIDGIPNLTDGERKACCEEAGGTWCGYPKKGCCGPADTKKYTDCMEVESLDFAPTVETL